MLSIKHSPESQIPAVGKLSEDALKVAATLRMEQRLDVLKHQPSGLYFPDDADGLEKEPGASAVEPVRAVGAPAAAGIADILARETRRDAVNAGEVVGAALAHVGEELGAGKSVSKQSPIGGVDFDLPGGSPTGLFKAEVEAADARKEAAEGFLSNRGRDGWSGEDEGCFSQPSRGCVLALIMMEMVTRCSVSSRCARSTGKSLAGENFSLAERLQGVCRRCGGRLKPPGNAARRAVRAPKRRLAPRRA